MDKSYELTVAGLKRQLPICPIAEGVYIAGFVMFSDVELTIACAEEMLKKVPEFDVIVTAESKGIPLAYEMSRQCGKKYILARKMHKLYMTNSKSVQVKSITTDKVQTLVLSGDDMDYLKAFLVGGALCLIGQILIDKTKLTPARILVAYVVAGVVLGGIGLYPKLAEFAGAGASVPLTGFGNTLAKGVREAVDKSGFIGIFTGGLTACASGICAAIFFGLIVALCFKAKDKTQ